MGNVHGAAARSSPTLTVLPVPGLQGGCSGETPSCPPAVPPTVAPFMQQGEWGTVVAGPLNVAMGAYPGGGAALRYAAWGFAPLTLLVVACLALGGGATLWGVVASLAPSCFLFASIIGFVRAKWRADALVDAECARLSAALAPRGLGLSLRRGGHKNKLRWLWVHHPPVYPMGAAPVQAVLVSAGAHVGDGAIVGEAPTMQAAMAPKGAHAAAGSGAPPPHAPMLVGAQAPYAAPSHAPA